MANDSSTNMHNTNADEGLESDLTIQNLDTSFQGVIVSNGSGEAFVFGDFTSSSNVEKELFENPTALAVMRTRLEGVLNLLEKAEDEFIAEQNPRVIRRMPQVRRGGMRYGAPINAGQYDG